MQAALKRLAALAVLAAACAWSAHAAEGGHHHHGFHGAEDWAKVFDDPKRDSWQKPHEVIQALALAPDAAVADIGAGTGYFTVRLAHMLPRGRVYAVDAEPDMVAHVQRRAQQAGLSNVRVVQASGADARLPEPVDLILLVDVYHHVEDRVRYFSRLRESLKQGGRLAVIDFRMDAPIGPPKSGRVAPETVRRELAQAGYAPVAEHDFLPYQYYFVLRPTPK